MSVELSVTDTYSDLYAYYRLNILKLKVLPQIINYGIHIDKMFSLIKNIFIMSENEKSHKAKIRFSLKSKEFEISGNENFVNEQIENFKSIIQGSLEKLVIQDEMSIPPKSKMYLPATEEIDVVDYVEEKNTASEKDILDFQDVVVIDGEIVKVIADVPGNTTSKKMISVILLYMWGKMKLGHTEISFKELREVCTDYGEIDRGNFSSIMNNQKKYFLISGSGQSQSAKLIRPGIKAAEELIYKLKDE